MTQKQLILNHMRNRGPITSVAAIGLYGITRLAAVILKLRQDGYEIEATKKRGVHGSQYAEYSL